MNDEQYQQAIRFLEDKAKAPSCPVCGHNHWEIPRVIISASQYTEGGGLVLGGISIPEFLTICTNCGYTRHFNAVLSGVVKRG